jgi:hypothetical protein
MSEATNMRVVSFAQDLIYDVMHKLYGANPWTCRSGCTAKKPYWFAAELVKVRQTLCRVGDSSNILNGILLDVKHFLCAVYAFPSIGDINEVRFLLFWLSKNIQCVSYHLQKTLCRNTQRAYFQAAVWKRTCQSIYQLKNKDWRKICCLLTGWTSSLDTLMLLISCGCKTICATKRCSCRSQGLSCTDAHIVKARIKERLYQREIVKVLMRKKIKTWNHSLREKVLVVRFQVLKHKINVTLPFLGGQINRITSIRLILERLELQ